jgi:Transposase DDE domain
MLTTPIPFFQPELRPSLPTIEGNVDYQTFQAQLRRIDELLRLSGLETQFVAQCLKRWQAAAEPDSPTPSAKVIAKYQQRTRQALRCNMARTLLQEEYRRFSVHLAESPLLQWFCAIDRLDVIQVPSKSALQRYADWAPSEEIRAVIDQLLQLAARQPSALELHNQVELDTVFFDATCLATNIHFPVDWVLLRDGTRTLVRAMTLIRQHGLCYRMPEPESFRRRMNQLCIQMSMANRAATPNKKAPKRVLRLMKQVVGTVRAHARRYREGLDRDWQKTDWTRPQAEQVLKRIDGVLALLPQAQQQAHERIIGERAVPNAEKIFSLYETDTQLLVRGKAGTQVEFGNKLWLAENPQGLILDFELVRDRVPGDGMQLVDSILRIEERLQVELKEVATDRGCDSVSSRSFLEDMEIYNGICPKGPRQLQARLKEIKFGRLQRRRSQTEGRIGIMKNNFLGRPLRAKGFAHRERDLHWAVLAHNLWVLARLPQAQAEPLAQAA